MEYLEKHLLVCFGSSCAPQGGESVRDAFKSELKARGIRYRIRDGNCTCLGLCREGVNAVIWPEGTYLAGLVAADVPRVVDYLEGKGEIPTDRVVLASEKIALRKAEGK